MAAPVSDHYGCASGGVIAAGRNIVPSWAENLVPNTWTAISNTNFLTWANANIPAGAYQGNFPFEAIVDAFSDGTYDPVTRSAFLEGGGHNDGSCNAVVKIDTRTLEYSLACAPTPPSKYPPSYYNGGNPQPGPLIYPSGYGSPGLSHFRNDLTDPLDTPYNTPYARKTSHMYTASCVRSGVVYYFYGNYAEFNSNNGIWNNVDGADEDWGNQFLAENTNFGSAMFQHGCCAVYDTVTDRAFVTFTPGDTAGGWRSHICKINLATRTIEDFIQISNAANYPLLSESQIYQVGRKIWVFMNTPSGAYKTTDTGAIYDIDTGGVEYFNMTGDATVYSGSNIETIPAVIHGGYIYKWLYNTIGDRDYFYKASLTPVSGVGTKADPYILTQTKTATANAAPTNGHLIYRRLWLEPVSGSILVLPRANSNLYALKLS